MKTVASSGKPLANSLWIVGGRLTSGAVTAIVIGALGRHLGPADFGRLNFVLTLIAIAMPWASFMLNGIVVRELVDASPERAGRVLGTALRLRFAAGAIGAAFLVGGVAVLQPAEVGWVALAGLTLLAQPAGIVDAWFQRHLASRRMVVAQTIAIYSGAALKLGLVGLGAPLGAFIAMIAIEGGLQAIAAIVAYRRSPERTGLWRWDGQLARRLARAGLPLAIGGMLSMLGTRFDQVFVALRLPEHDAGLYLAASRFTEFILFTGYALLVSLFPALAEAQARGDASALRDRLNGLFGSVGLWSWGAALGTTVLAEPILRLVLGESYLAAAPLLVAQVWAAIPVLSAMARWEAVLITTTTSWNLVSALTILGGQSLVIGPLVERWGAAGAAGAAAAGALLGGVATSTVIPALRPLAGPQWTGLVIGVMPWRWRAVWRQLTK